ncbi:SCP2 sterol-binding domain-containing protein [Govanella unica]|uniref:SCP2 sterol-binding domain-containing protein n=1 Tax=Govanella unica TaxID=2975056 RepID=A0A9X3TZS2_9PROT|nr:SCP2 sterol-binding domain-containing protein [Govania unica]MDA5194961.1 SCP2 sterol-binding domain-containing protein [Govania unica]
MSIDSIIQGLQGKLSGLGLARRIKIDLGSDGILLIDGTAKPPAISRADGPADVTLTTDSSVLQEILAGDLNAQMAFMTGKLKIDGDMALAMQLGQALG